MYQEGQDSEWIRILSESSTAKLWKLRYQGPNKASIFIINTAVSTLSVFINQCVHENIIYYVKWNGEWRKVTQDSKIVFWRLPTLLSFCHDPKCGVDWSSALVRDVLEGRVILYKKISSSSGMFSRSFISSRSTRNEVSQESNLKNKRFPLQRGSSAVMVRKRTTWSWD